MTLRIEQVAVGDARWDPFVHRQDRATFCHMDAWGRVMEETFGHPSFRLVAVGEDDIWKGILPLVQVKSRLFGDYLLSMPFLNYGGPLGTHEARTLLAHEARGMARDLGVDLLELRNRQPLDSDLTISHRKITILLSLPSDAETLWKDELRAKVRSQIRRPRKEGMEARFGALELDAFYQVFTRNMRDLGTPVLPRSFFESIQRELSDEFVVCAIYHGDLPVAAGCGFLYGGEFELTWASSLREYNRMAPNMLLYWSLMEEMIGRRAHTFNFGRCTPDSGTHRFKRQWGGEDAELPWVQWSPGGMTATPAPDQGRYRMAVEVWRRLPVRLTKSIGPLLARSLP